jgi:N-acetylmuramic acid 6-phosphate etherase
VCGSASAQETPREQALHFIREETQFHLGCLPTEQSHPKTRGLSQALQTDSAKGLRMLLSVDDDIPPVAKRVIASPEFALLRQAVRTALDSDRTIYFSGCGATGRLSILLDAANRRFWREAFEKQPGLKDVCGDMGERTCAVMTGGDFALIRSVESFEDYVTFGYHQMEQAGAREGDVVVAISEGGETSSVIGTVLRGVDVKAKVFFLFNNPAELLAKNLERCRRVIENNAVTTLVLCTGPMAVAGSTRMQATTIELLVAGAAFEAGLADHLAAKLTAEQRELLGVGRLTPECTVAQFETLLGQLRSDTNVAALARMMDGEADLYGKKGRITYFANEYLLDIFTDTTERSPTFKIPPFRGALDTTSPASWAFVKDPLRPTPEAWLRLVGHEPRCLEWAADTYARLQAAEKIVKNPPLIGRKALHTYLVGREPDVSRTEAKPNAAMAVLVGDEASLLDAGSHAAWRQAFAAAAAPFEERAALVVGRRVPQGWAEKLVHVDVDVPVTPLRLFDHLALKLALNNVSSATMGKMGRLSSNWMAHVDASNKKLIDRSVRLIVELAGVDYETACVALFESLEEMKGWDEARRKTTSPAAYTVERIQARRSAYLQPALDWQLGLGDMKGSLAFFGPEAMREKKIERAADTVTGTWTGHAECGDAFTVTVRWQRTADALWNGDLAYEGYSGKRFVEEIHFPSLPCAYAAGSSFVFGGHDSGTVSKGAEFFKPGAKQRRTYCGGMQFSALINTNGPSLYIDHRDPAVGTKGCEIEIAKEGGRLIYTGVHVPGVPDQPPAAYRIPYPSCYTTFKGDWFEAGQIYKKWGAAQPWYANRKGVNPLRKIGMWVWNRGLIKDALPPVERLQKELGDITVAVDWYWWHSNPYDTDYPDFWPPREGVEPFHAAVARLKGQGIYAQVYINGVCWDIDGKTWKEGGEEGVFVQRDGQPRNTAFNRYNHHRLAYMCGEAPKFQDRISSVVGHLRESGLNGQYLDMIGNSTMAGRCYNPRHSHPKGGGSFGPDGYRVMLQRLKRENPDYPLTTEGANEAYLDLMDGSIYCNSTTLERLDAIPLFQSVYHGNYAFFGNYAYPDGTRPWDPLWPPEDRWKEEKPWHKLYPDQFYLELGRTVAWGAQPMVCNIKESLFADPELEAARRFMIETVRFYYANREFLFDGQMLSPSGFTCQTAPVDFLIRSIFTKEHECKPRHAEQPAVLHSCWQAPGGKKALILVNWTRAEQPWTFNGVSGTLPAHAYDKRLLP